jgi:TRAP-type mannitol/chloroaromatic compound transport system permease small subunit
MKCNAPQDPMISLLFLLYVVLIPSMQFWDLAAMTQPQGVQSRNLSESRNRWHSKAILRKTLFSLAFSVLFIQGGPSKFEQLCLNKLFFEGTIFKNLILK